MNNDEIVQLMRTKLAPTIRWYQRVLDEGEPDSSFLYDETIMHLEANLSRGDAEAIVRALL